MKVDGVDPVVLQRVETALKQGTVPEVEKAAVREKERKKEVPSAEAKSREAAIAKEELLKAAGRLNAAADIFDFEIRFEVNFEEGEVKVLVIDKEEKRVIRRLPPSKLLEMASRLEHFLGVLLDVFV